MNDTHLNYLWFIQVFKASYMKNIMDIVVKIAHYLSANAMNHYDQLVELL